jgi:hypothetical protein
MHRLSFVLVAAAVVAAPRTDARACMPLGGAAHVVIASMQATDQVPPALPAIPPPDIHRSDGSNQGGCGTDCPDVGIVSFAAVATDDTTPPDKIGYRFTLAAGQLPAGFTLPAAALDPQSVSVSLFWSADRGQPIDFTLSVVAIDAAGNESPPQTVRVADDPGGCAIAHPRPHARGLAWIALLSLIAARRRRKWTKRPTITRRSTR